ncbi:helix-turn-helix domain-containing protein [Streptomyces sp. NPDC049954]|uniref:helix-turn-helix domain-containing protein n=1 Tax=Streptomyces sp. NPDC049954 TaxID=3155779 RepID=UPI003426D074
MSSAAGASGASDASQGAAASDGRRSPPRAPRSLPDHPVRVALLDLLAEVGTLTSTQAAARLGHSSGLCSFHLRQLARHGLIEEAPHSGGKARPWRLRWEGESEGGRPDDRGHGLPEGFAGLSRELEDESYDRWRAERDRAPSAWREDESFSAVLHLTPEELTALADSVRGLLAEYRERETRPGTRPAGSVPVAAVVRMFPLVDGEPGRGEE